MPLLHSLLYHKFHKHNLHKYDLYTHLHMSSNSQRNTNCNHFESCLKKINLTCKKMAFYPSWNETPGSLLALKKRCVGGRRSAAGGRRGSLLWAVGSRRSAVGGWVGQSALGGRRWWTCGGESSLGAERSTSQTSKRGCR